MLFPNLRDQTHQLPQGASPAASHGLALRASATAAFVFSPRRSLARILPSGPMRKVEGMAVAPKAETMGESGPTTP